MSTRISQRDPNPTAGISSALLRAMKDRHDVNATVIVRVHHDVRKPGYDKFPRAVDLADTT